VADLILVPLCNYSLIFCDSSIIFHETFIYILHILKLHFSCHVLHHSFCIHALGLALRRSVISCSRHRSRSWCQFRPHQWFGDSLWCLFGLGGYRQTGSPASFLQTMRVYCPAQFFEWFLPIGRQPSSSSPINSLFSITAYICHIYIHILYFILRNTVASIVCK